MASQYDGATVEVLNWKKYNPRFDSKRPSWFRVDNCLALGQGFFGLNCEHKWLWIVILSLACEKVGEAFVWNTAFITAITGISEKTQDQALDTFIKFGRLSVTRAAPVRVTPATNERTNERYDTNVTNVTNKDSSAVDKNKDPSTRTADAASRGAIPEFSDGSNRDELLAKVTHAVQRAWLKTYPDADWVIQEIQRAHTWTIANPRRAPKTFGPFMTNWLGRAFESYRKGIPSRRLSNSEVNAQALGELWKQVQAEKEEEET